MLFLQYLHLPIVLRLYWWASASIGAKVKTATAAAAIASNFFIVRMGLGSNDRPAGIADHTQQPQGVITSLRRTSLNA